MDNARMCGNRGFRSIHLFKAVPWNGECWHWHAGSVMPFASWQTSLQNSFPSAGTQLRPGCAHFGDVLIDCSFKSALKVTSRALVPACHERP